MSCFRQSRQRFSPTRADTVRFSRAKWTRGTRVDYRSAVLVVLIVADSVRADAPNFGGGAARTDLLDRLAAEGTVFDDAYASAGWTVPSMISIATGTYPHRVGVSRWRHPFPQHRPTLMTAFAAAGFDVQTVVHNPRFCLANTGFRGTVSDSEIPDDVEAALRAPVGTDRFVLIHHWWTHLPYVNAKLGRKDWKRACDVEIEALGHEPEDAVPRLRGDYHDALSWLDAELMGRWLEAAKSGGQDVLFAFTADHGETWGDSLPDDHAVEHMYDLHGRWLTDETTHVPLVLWGKGVDGPIPAGRQVGGFARGVDLAPTLCGLAGVPWPGPIPTHEGPTLVDRGIGTDGGRLELDGVSLADAVMLGRRTPHSEALTVTSHNAIVPARYPKSGRRMWSRFALRTDRRRYTWDGLFGLRDVDDVGTPEAPGRVGLLKDRLVGVPRIWSRLADERAVALGPTTKLPREVYPRLPSSTDDEDDGGLEDAMRMLGYSGD